VNAVALVRIALSIVADRAISILVLISASVMCGWTMWDPKWERVTAFSIFVIFGYLLVRAREASHAAKSESEKE
jgi:hypothetical protein